MSGFRVVVLRQNEPQSETFADILGRRAHRVSALSHTSEVEPAVLHEGVDLVVVGLPLAEPASEVIPALRALLPGIPLVVVGADADVQQAADAFELGAQEYLADVGPGGESLLGSVGLLLGARRRDSQLLYLMRKQAAEASLDGITGESEAMLELRRVLRHLVRHSGPGQRPTILLIGETGTGKGLVAKTLHFEGARRNAPFVDINCAAIPHSLIESELFGYERGAFTDAHAARPGLFETADGGTLFLDEISSLPLQLQGKLLTAVEDQVVRRIGARQSLRVDVQVIAATHRDLGELVREGSFRQDLYHRLDVLSVTIPPLRERADDSVLLAGRFLVELCARYGIARHFESDAFEAIRSYPWPGNVRELRNRIERAILLGAGESVGATQLELRPRAASSGSAELRSTSEGGLEVSLPPDGLALEAVERAVIVQALRLSEGNVSAAARFLRIGRQKLMYRIRRHGIDEAGPGA